MTLVKKNHEYIPNFTQERKKYLGTHTTDLAKDTDICCVASSFNYELWTRLLLP
jgi:hypothetical protein